MFRPIYCVLLWILPLLYYSGTSATDLHPYLTLYPPGDLEYTDVVVRRVGDNLTLVCELKGEAVPRLYFWNFERSDNSSEVESPATSEPHGPSLGSRYTKQNLSQSDSGHYVCSAPPHSISKFVLVQTKGPRHCSSKAFWCGTHCVLPSYVCDGYKDCKKGEDETHELCMTDPCSRADSLKCSSGRCISSAACCRSRDPLCTQHACCNEHKRFSQLEGEGYGEVEYPPLYEDRHAPDEYGFIQSTIYTVTACALIFMIAVVLLVSAICKMHMKRAALRSYTHATRHHYSQRYSQQTHRFPPCYEASRLLEQERTGNITRSPQHTAHDTQDNSTTQCNQECPPNPESPQNEPNRGFPLAALSAIFTQRYRQIPTQCLDVEMSDVRPSSCNSSPTRSNRTRLDHYRSPTYCDLNSELFYNQDSLNCGRELNYMSTVEYIRQPIRNVRTRPLTLQLGRFQLSIPRLGRRQSLDRRPDTPNVAELNIDDLDFVRLNSNETYTLNGRTIRLLGANFENYPSLDSSRPPPYNDSLRYKLYGPPPEYLSRDCLSDNNVTEENARSNVEMPPGYDELASGVNSDNVIAVVAVRQSDNDNYVANGDNCNNGNIGDDIVANDTSDNNITCDNNVRCDNITSGNNVRCDNITSGNNVRCDNITSSNNIACDNIVTNNTSDTNITNMTDMTNGNTEIETSAVNVENLSSIIDNLPAIDCDVNANERDITNYVNSDVC